MNRLLGRDQYDWAGWIISTLVIWMIACLWTSVVHAGEVPTGDLEVVYQTIAMESASEPEGMKYVALTLINRARKRGTTPEIEAKRPWQYSCFNDPGWAKRWIRAFYTPKTRHKALIAWGEALKLSLKPELQGIRHYHRFDVHPSWANGHTPAFRSGSHLFYRGIN